MAMNIKVFTPDRVVCSITANEIVLPGLTGKIGVLNGHSTLVTALDTGLLRIKSENKWVLILLCGGLAEINQNKLTILVNDVEEFKDLKLSNVLKEVKQAALVVETSEKNKDQLNALYELKKATARLEALNYL